MGKKDKPDLTEAFEAVFGPKPEKGTPERRAYKMGKDHLDSLINMAEEFRQESTSNKQHNLIMHKAASEFGISDDYADFPKAVRKELEKINKRFRKRYKREINSINR